MSIRQAAQNAQSVNELVNIALAQWVKITNTDPENRTLTIRRGEVYQWSAIYLGDLLTELNESRELDPSGLTTFLMLRGLLREYLEDTKVSAKDLFDEPDRVGTLLDALRELRAVLDDARVADLTDAFRTQICRAAAHYGVPDAARPALDAVLGDVLVLGYLRRAAFRSVATLEAHQFVQGQPDPRPLGYNPAIWEFWNIQSLLQAMQAQGFPGVTMCLIRDMQHDLFSFFVLAVRNGETLTVLTDREKVPHPDHKNLSRGRAVSRTFEERVNRHWFPYHLVGAALTPDQKEFFVARSTALVPTCAQAALAGHLRDLPPREFVWTVLVFALLREQYGVQNKHLPEVSYTGDMIAEPHALCAPAGELVRSGAYRPLALPPITPSDMQKGAQKGAFSKSPNAGHNRWMTERYGARVPDVALNVLGADRALPATQDALAQVASPALERAYMHGGSLHRRRTDDEFISSDEGTPHQLDAMDPLAFDTAERLDRDRHWVARKNHCAVVQVLALEEFDATKDAVRAWFLERVTARLDVVLDAAARGTWVLPRERYRRDPFDDAAKHATKSLPEEALRQQSHDYDYHYSEAIWGVGAGARKAFPSARGLYVGEHCDVIVRGPVFDRKAWRFKCFLDKAVEANVTTEIKPRCAAAVAELTGVAWRDLPWQVQHWLSESPYTGNHILDRVDPEEWALTNPWMHFTFRVVVKCSKRALNARRKALGLGPRDWSALNPHRG